MTRLQRRLGRGLIPSQVPQWVADTVAAFFRTHKTDLERIDITELTPFEQSALRAAATIPPGEVRSYGWVARAIGQPAAVRAVGRAMARNPVPLLYPCHRVVDATGAIVTPLPIFTFREDTDLESAVDFGIGERLVTAVAPTQAAEKAQL